MKRTVAVIDRWQRRHRTPAVTYGVIKKFGDDNANMLVVALGWYGFTAIYPLLLVVVTVFGYIGAALVGPQHRAHPAPVPRYRFSVQPR
jgi:uncharacterized BrkB/YihY/UPF0761 family membrane protein